MNVLVLVFDVYLKTEQKKNSTGIGAIYFGVDLGLCTSCEADRLIHYLPPPHPPEPLHTLFFFSPRWKFLCTIRLSSCPPPPYLPFFLVRRFTQPLEDCFILPRASHKRGSASFFYSVNFRPVKQHLWWL